MRTDYVVVQHFTDAEKSVRLYVGFPGSELSPSVLCLQDADVMSQLQTNYSCSDRFVWTGIYFTKFSWRRESSLTTSGFRLKSGLVIWCWQSALVVEFYVLERRRSTSDPFSPERVSTIHVFFLCPPSGILFTFASMIMLKFLSRHEYAD